MAHLQHTDTRKRSAGSDRFEHAGLGIAREQDARGTLAGNHHYRGLVRRRIANGRIGREHVEFDGPDCEPVTRTKLARRGARLGKCAAHERLPFPERAPRRVEDGHANHGPHAR
jgi:hypothetical protein